MISNAVQDQSAAAGTQNTLQLLHDAKAQKVAREFESIFTTMMLKSMRGAAEGLNSDNDFMPTSLGEKIYTQMLDEQYGDLASKNGTLGIAAMILKQLQKTDTDDTQSLSMLKGLAATRPWTLDNKFIPSSSAVASTTPAADVSRWAPIIAAASKQYGLDPNLLCAVIAQESGGDPAAISQKGAKGLMQLMDSTSSSMGVTQPFSPQSNIMGGAKYLRQLLDQFNGDESLALASYNAGPAAVERYNGIPPFSETQRYVKDVQSLKQTYCGAQSAQTLTTGNTLHGHAH
jgi:soluble lytic murein transglycosylase-like protein